MMDDPLGKLGSLLADRYRFIRLLGSGTTGHVYLAVDESLGREVAVKMTPLRPSDALKEPAFDAPIVCENVLNILSQEIIDGSHVMVSEYCRGGPLSSRLKEKAKTLCCPLHPVVAIDVLAQACLGLEAIHKCGRLHRRISPENILLTEPAPEFGSAKLTNGGQVIREQTPIPNLSLPYIAPEIHMGEAATVRSDIYSVGITLYRVVTGRFPYDISRPYQESIKAKINGDLIPVSHAADVDPRLQSVIMRAIQAAPGKRQESAAEVREGLISVLIDLSVEHALKVFRQTVDFQQADRSLTNLCVRFPGYVRPYLELAKLCVQVGLASRAARVYHAASQNIEGSTELLLEIAQFKHAVEKDPRAAIVYLRQALIQDNGQLEPERRQRAELTMKQWVTAIQS